MVEHVHPESIGPYTILEVLGEGGMGVVYLAAQQEPVRRTVALKVLRADRGSEGVLARFKAERQALAVMDHPCIAKVFDAGVTEDGRSYFAMERVDGLPLTEYCDARRMSVRNRVHLFAEVCHAVQHAHQKGLIHRDLKPSNVLVSEVDGRPLPRVIDFGIAKAVEDDDFQGDRLTRDDQVIGTPAYMSPEQIGGSRDIDTRSDIYSLGILLYEVLVGHLPFGPDAYRGWAAVAAAIYRDPPTPTQRLAALDETRETVARLRGTTVSGLRGELRGDLDFIVSRAMDRDRAERYETANGLALDLERYLADEPVRARAGGTAYTLRKFVRRHRVAVGFLGTLVAGLSIFAVTTAVQAQRIARARDLANARRDQAEGLIDFMLVDLRQKLEAVGSLDLLDGVGQQAMAYFASLPEEEFSDAELLSRSKALYQIGSVRLDEGRSADAVEAFQASLRLARELSERNPEDAALLFGLSQSHFYVGYAAWLKEDLDGAEAEFLAYLDAANRLVALDPTKIEYRMEVGYAQSNLGSVREARGDLVGAEEAFENNIVVAEELAARDSTDITALGELSESHNHLAVVYRKQGRYPEALEQHRAELALKQQVLRLSPGHAYWENRLAYTHYFMGNLLTSTGRVEEALESFGAAIRIMEGFLAKDPSNARWRRSSAMVRMSEGQALSALGRTQSALADLGSAVTRMRELVATDPTGFDWRMDLTQALGARARARSRAGRLEAALQDTRDAQALLAQEDQGRRQVREATARTGLIQGQILRGLGQEAEGRAALEAARAVLEALVEQPGGFEFRPHLAETYLALGRRDEARRELRTLFEHGYGERTLVELAEAAGLTGDPSADFVNGAGVG